MHRAHFAVALTRENDVAALQSSVLHEQVRDDAFAFADLGFEHDALGRTLRVALQFEHFALEEHALEQFFDADAFDRADLDHRRLAAPFFGDQAEAREAFHRLLRIGFGFVDLRQRHDDRHFGCTCVRQRFFGARHRTVVGCDDEHDQVDGFRAACAHRREGGVTGSVDDRERVALLRFHLIRADVLRDAAGFALGDA